MNRVIAARTDPQTARAYWTMGRGDSERAYRAARQHSRLVRVLRIVIPAVVLLTLASVVMITYFNPLRMLGKLPVDISNLVVSGTKITMEQPRLSGFTRDARAYEFTADAAAQDLTKPDIIELHNIHAKVQMQDKSIVQMSAVSGIYNSKAETLKLERNIVLNSSSGYHGRLSEALVDVRKGNVISEHPVTLSMLQGTLRANGLEIVNSGELIRFEGGVNMTMMLNKQKGAGAVDKIENSREAGAQPG
jgi:lipopolysaccharide export system protein LptC